MEGPKRIMLQGILEKFEPTLRHIYQWMVLPPPPNLEGDRHVEFSWIASHLPIGAGRALDFGCGNSYLALMAAMRGFDVTAIDLTPVKWAFTHPGLRFIQTDVFDLDCPPSSLNLIINCSAVEHVGLGRYGDQVGVKGDLEAMKLMRSLLKPTGVMLLTVPVGKDAVFAPMHRVYGPERLPRLLEGFRVKDEKYWVKDYENRWVAVTREEALQRPPRQSSYGLGCLVLEA